MMGRIRIPAYFLIVLMVVMATSPVILHGQVPVVKSTERVVIRGKNFFIHKVEKGQTAFSIARAYSVTVEVLHNENPEALYGLKEGQMLKIPVVDVVEKPVREKDPDKYIYHTIVAGETIFALSRMYDVPQSAILEANPGLDPEDIPVGSEIAIPRKEFRSEIVSIAPRQEDYTVHKVLPGETISSISRKYGVSAREIRRINGGTIFIRPGDLVRIPGRHEIGGEQQVIIADTVIAEIDTLEIMPRAVGYTDISNLRGSIDIAVMLPLHLDRNAERVEIDTTLPPSRRIRERPFSWIYPGTVSFLEMYEGILIAADDMRDAGLDVRIHAFDTRANPDVVDEIVESGRLRNMDMIIGPIYSYNLTRVLPYATRYNIPVVSPVPLHDNSLLKENPGLFIVHSSLETEQEIISRTIADYYDNNMVFLYSDTATEGNESMPFRNMIMRELSFRTPVERVNFKQVMYRSRSGFANDTLNRLSHALTPASDNLIILGTEDEAVLHESIMNLHGLLRRNRITVFGYHSIRNLENNIDLNYLFDLGINVFSPVYIDYSHSKTTEFLGKFRSLFGMEPNETSFAWIGYDIVTYFTSGLAMHGRRFIANPGMHNPELLSAKFDFRRESPADGYENWGLFRLRYSGTMELVVISEPQISNGLKY